MFWNNFKDLIKSLATSWIDIVKYIITSYY